MKQDDLFPVHRRRATIAAPAIPARVTLRLNLVERDTLRAAYCRESRNGLDVKLSTWIKARILRGAK